MLAPFLGEPYGTVLAAGDLALVFDEALESFAIAYHHHRFPIRPEDYPAILRAGGEDFEALAQRFEGGGRPRRFHRGLPGHRLDGGSA